MTTTPAAETAEVGETDPTHPAPSDGTRAGSDSGPTGTAPSEAPEVPDEASDGGVPDPVAPVDGCDGGDRASDDADDAPDAPAAPPGVISDQASDTSDGGDDDVEATAVIRLPARPISPPTADDPEAGEASDGEIDTTTEMRLPSAPLRPTPESTEPKSTEPERREPERAGPGLAGPVVTEGGTAERRPRGRAVAASSPLPGAPETASEAMAPADRRSPEKATPAAARPSRMTTVMRSAAVWLPPLLTIEGLIMYVLAVRVAPGPLRGVDVTKIDALGLISAMPMTAFAAILLMLVAFFVTIAQNTDRKFLLLFQIAAITFALHGASALISDEARFPTAYVHAGFVEYINRTGESSAILDARLAWPGFFALVAFVTKAAGVTDLSMIMRWTPLLSNLLYLLPFVLILRQVVATTRARWFAALLFVIVQWIGQDYFSSQGFTYAIYLAFVAIVLRWFGKVEPRDKPMPAKGRVRRLLARLDGLTPGELPHSTGVYDRVIMLIVLIGLFGTATASHQITPFMMLGALSGLILLRRTSLSWALPFFLGLIVLSWISYQTVTFWSGHIDQLFGGLGRILQNLQSNTGDRIDGSDPRHALVLMARLGICGVILALAAIGLLRRVRRGVGDRAALLLLCIPVLALGLQSYGGEIGLRIYLFALPGACILAAYAFFPNLPAGTEDAPEETVPIRRRNIRFNPELTRRISLLLAAGCAMALAMVFLVARYGNEQFERVSASEVAAMHYIYDHDEPSARVLYLSPVIGPEVTPIIPWGERDFDKISYEQALVNPDPAHISPVIDKLRASPPNTYLVATRAQAGYLQLNHGYPDDWAPRFRATLDASKELKRVFNGEDAAVYTLKSFPEGTEIPERGVPLGGSDPTSPWTPVGLVALGVTWIALFTYQVFLLRGREQRSRARRRILFIAVPAFVLALAVIAERFVVIGYQLQ
ncbi:hypothetical protein [Streptosporangium amethystogenes]|uniref:hypothetical protein n=1 Tax=Streptosporangium amethystogenes TaxID=2002 RepID=UPI00068C3398|nr:hypothetical protein [Streptosporangium amethystogenes]